VKLNPLQAQMKISAGQKKEIQKQVNAAIDVKKELFELASSFKAKRHFGEAIYCFRELLERSLDRQDDVKYLFALGQIVEKMHDFESALNYYREAANLCSTVSDVSYWINNNTGYCLCMLKRFAEAEDFCHTAIDLDSSRFDAFKNLGLSQQGQGKLRDAMDAYIKAIKIYPQDVRAMNLFENILDKHPELKDEYAEQLEECRNLVQNSYQYHKPEKHH
ncbi:MAG TPA: tetratricopeptide repeat protein, partial [Smithellaceae bacterium]|nr:tetratricopeptide repeat protein [Smithellaceae bacterium]